MRWLPGVRRVDSPNANERPAGVEISLLVIHNISLPPGEFGGDHVERFFCNQLNCDEHPYFQTVRMLQVSAHLFIKRCGTVTQFVPFDARAWHAGESFFDGRSNCNDFSIGVELEGADTIHYTAAQYASLVEVTKKLMAAFPRITPDRIVGHSDIAPVRKTDPGPAFDWALYRAALADQST